MSLPYLKEHALNGIYKWLPLNHYMQTFQLESYWHKHGRVAARASAGAPTIPLPQSSPNRALTKVMKSLKRNTSFLPWAVTTSTIIGVWNKQFATVIRGSKSRNQDERVGLNKWARLEALTAENWVVLHDRRINFDCIIERRLKAIALLIFVFDFMVFYLRTYSYLHGNNTF